MADQLTRLWVRVANALLREDGQAITEYAIVVGVLMAAIAAAITSTHVGTAIVSTITSAL